MYKTQSPDTSVEVEKLQFERLRRIGRARRFEEGLALVDESIETMLRALQRLHPQWSEEQVQQEWIRVQYGEELAQRVAQYRERKNQQ